MTNEDRRRARGIPELPETPLAALPSDTKLFTRDVAAHQRQTVGCTETRRYRRSPLSPPWHKDEHGWCYIRERSSV